MSNTALHAVWDHATVSGTDLAVLLAIADQLRDTTGVAWIGLPKLADRTNVTVRTVQRSLRALETTGHLDTLDRPGRGNEYRLGPVLDGSATPVDNAGTPDAHVTPDTDVTPDAHVTGPLTPTSPDPRRPRHPRPEVTKKTNRERGPAGSPVGLTRALITACYGSTARPTASELAHIARAADELADVGATPDQVHDAAARARATWTDGRVTATALVRRWASLTTDETPAPVGLDPTATAVRLATNLAGQPWDHVLGALPAGADEHAALDAWTAARDGVPA